MGFESILASLNDRQLEAVETIYGPVLVIAWPGSGKTQLLAARIANILQTTDYLPSNILCLTFTENAARNMRERLATMIGWDAYRVAIHTFHSFGNEILNRFRSLTREYTEAKPIDQIESLRILDSILETLPWDHPYKPGFRASDTIREVLGNIGNLKKWGITPPFYRMILELNKRAIDTINPLISEYWTQIDNLGQKKEDKEKKIELFEKFTDKVRQLSVSEKNIGNYERFETVFVRSLEEAWDEYAGDAGTKFMNSWRDAWTQKNYKNIRELKETTKYPKQLALADIYETYQDELRKRSLIDFSDMILEAIRLIEEYDIVRMSLAEQYQFVMIDEFQDTNEAQMRLINGILSVNPENPNIFAVGDDDQSIYKFQWANTKNIRDFHDTYSDTRLIILEKNYRSQSEIITESRTVIKSESNDISKIFPWALKKFDAIRTTGGIVRKSRFHNELEEISWIIEDIAWKIESGVHPRNIALIAKKNKTLELIAKWLLEKHIPVSLSKDESIFESDIIMLVTDILKLLHSLEWSYEEEDKELLVRILSHPCFQIDRLILWNISKTIYHARRDTTRSWIETLSHHEERNLKNLANFFRELSLRAHTERLEDIIDMITGANSLSIPDDYDDGVSNPLQIDMFWWVREEYISPLFSYYFGHLSNNNWSNMEYTRYLMNIRAFIESIRSYKKGRSYLTLHDAIEILGLIEKYGITIEIPHIIGNEENSLNLITVYKAKWLEWDQVYVPCIHTREYKSGKISGSTLPKNLPLEADRDDESDIERLVYTAYTRAKDTLTLTYSRESIDEKSLEPLPCIGWENPEWDEETGIPLSSLTKTLELEKKELFALPYLWDERDFLQDRIEKIFVMNATALQNFLNIVDAGPEYFVANSLLRFPQAKNISASYGSAIHHGLEVFFADYSKKWTFMKSLLIESFEKSLKEEGFDPQVESDYLTQWREILESLYTEITGKTYGELFLEYDFRVAHGGIFLPITGTSTISSLRSEQALNEGKDPETNETLDSSYRQNDETKNQEPRTKNHGAIQLTGKIDRIECLPDDTLIITDYKTGSGFDSFDGRGAEYEKIKQWKYRLQLAFYAILFELSPRWRIFPKKQFELFFVEKNRDEDRFHRITEYIQQGEIERTKKLIIAVMGKIHTLDFPDISKYPKTLEWIRMFEEDLLNNQCS